MFKFLLFLLLLIHTSYCDVDDFSLPTYSTAISRVVIDYILNFYFHAASTVDMFHRSNSKHENINLDIMNEVLYNAQAKVVVQVEGLKDLKISSRKRINNIIFVDSYDSFMEFFKRLNYKYFDFQGKYLIIVTIPTNDIYKTMLKIFEALWTKHIINSNILFMPPENSNEAMVYTYYPYSRFNCEDVVPVLLNQYRGNQWLRYAQYFPKKLKDFYGCPLIVATYNNPPFMMIKSDENGDHLFDGMEGILLRVLSKVYNFKIDLHVPEELWGYIYPNKTSTGAMKMVVDNEVNMTLGFFASIPERDEIMQPSYVYYTTNLVWMVPPGKPQSAIGKLANPLDNIVWIMSITTFIIGFVVIAAIKKQSKPVQNFVFGNKIQSPAMNFINVVLGNSITRLPMRNFSRFLLLMAIIYYFIIRTCYSSGLVKFMQMDTRGKHMMSTAEMLENNLTFYMMEATRLYISQMPEILERSVTLSVSKFNKMSLDMIKDPYYDGGFLTSAGHLAYRNLQVYPKYFHEYTPTPIFTVNIVIYMTLGSCLTQTFNEFILSIVSSGLINKWASFHIDEKYLKKPNNDELKTLSLEQLEGAFQLLIGGLILGFIAFCFENLIYFAKKFHRKLQAAASI